MSLTLQGQKVDGCTLDIHWDHFLMHLYLVVCLFHRGDDRTNQIPNGETRAMVSILVGKQGLLGHRNYLTQPVGRGCSREGVSAEF